ncbi:MAG: DUF1634 domain-containing protein [Candidatus Limnocylindrales bacterium]
MTPERLRGLVSSVLLAGVLVSATLITLGFASSFFVGWRGSLLGLAAGTEGKTDFGGLLVNLGALRPQAIAQLGLLVLIATPILRVATSLVGFAAEGDRLYVAITGFVLAVLVVSALFIR